MIPLFGSSINYRLSVFALLNCLHYFLSHSICHVYFLLLQVYGLAAPRGSAALPSVDYLHSSSSSSLQYSNSHNNSHSLNSSELDDRSPHAPLMASLDQQMKLLKKELKSKDDKITRLTEHAVMMGNHMDKLKGEVMYICGYNYINFYCIMVLLPPILCDFIIFNLFTLLAKCVVALHAYYCTYMCILQVALLTIQLREANGELEAKEARLQEALKQRKKAKKAQQQHMGGGGGGVTGGGADVAVVENENARLREREQALMDAVRTYFQCGL